MPFDLTIREFFNESPETKRYLSTYQHTQMGAWKCNDQPTDLPNDQHTAMRGQREVKLSVSAHRRRIRARGATWGGVHIILFLRTGI